jgi:RNA polymerase subunit RPABC4/transcription elongation factor Spt4
LEEILARSVQVFLALAGGYLIVLWFALVVWTYRDIGSRSQSVVTQIFATLMSLLFFVPGALLYLLMRPRTTLDEAFQRSLEEEYLLQDIEEAALCPSCQRQVSDDFILCPHCQASLQHACSSCNQLIKIGWPVCPYCGSDQSEQAISIRERVEPPAERYLERGSRTFRQVTAPTIREIPAPQPELEMGYQAELSAVVTETETQETVTVTEEGEPIRLFDRKRTRARKQKATNGNAPAAEVSSSASEEFKVTLDEAVVEDAAVISQFVANGNGNGNGAHDFETISGSAEVVEEVEGEDSENVDVVKSSSSGR